MALKSTLNFLPSVFQTTANEKFLGATLDQLVVDAENVKLNGYIGRTFAPTYRQGDNYINEFSAQRQNYQLEGSVVVKDKNGDITFNSGYIDLLNSITTNGGFSNNHQRLFSSQAYSYDGHFDYDKFVNYYNYYWLPNGPLDSSGNPTSVAVYANQTPYQATYDVVRNTNIGGYTFSGAGNHPNLQLTLARGGTYTFNINQPGISFWIQTNQGTSGVDPNINTLSTRQILGVKNNGTDLGSITFQVPLANAQDFYVNNSSLPLVASVNSAVTLHYTDIQNQLLSTFLSRFPGGIDGTTSQLNGKTLVFVNNDVDDTYWTTPNLGAVVTSTITLAPGSVVHSATRTNVWKINLVPTNTGDSVIQLAPSTAVGTQQKVFVNSGNTYAGNYFWLNNNYQYQKAPAITANLDTLYYQDSSNPDFVGVIKIVDNIGSTIDVTNDILGQVGYTSPNGVIFTNGLKITFDSYVTPSSYANNSYYVEGVGTSIALAAVDALVVPESYGDDIDTSPDYITINRGSQDLNPWTRYNRWFHKDVITATATYNNDTPNYGTGIAGRRPIVEFEANLQLFNFGSYFLPNIDIINFTASDAFANVEGQITTTVNGEVLAEGQTVIFTNDYDTNVSNKVYQVQMQTIQSRNFITLVDTGITILPGAVVTPVLGTNQGVTFHFDGTAWHNSQIKYNMNQPPLFDLYDADGYSFSNTTVYPGTGFSGSQLFGYAVPVTTAGNFVVGQSYTIYSVGTTDFTAIGASANEFGVSFIATGTGSGTGTATVTANADAVLGFPLSYQNFNNIGDIVFSNYYDTDIFTQFTAQLIGTTVSGEFKETNCNTGYMVKNSGTKQTLLSNWVANRESTEQYQLFTKFYDQFVVSGNSLTLPANNDSPPPATLKLSGNDFAFVQIDVVPAAQATVPHLKVFLNNKLLAPTQDYFLAQYGIYYVVALIATPALNDKIDVLVFGNTISTLGYYQISDNLDLNPLNEEFPTITLGQIRSHYAKLVENTSVNNIALQDNYLKAQGGTLIQHQSPLIYAMAFLNDPTANFVSAVNLARKEYQKFKNKFLSLCSSLSTLDYADPASSVDTILQNINAIKNNSFPWYYSDMVPQGSEYTALTYTVLNARQTNYEINSIFNNSVLSNRAVLVWVNGEQCTLGIDYTFSSSIPVIVFSRTLNVGDTILIRDYANTDGNYIPETPSKLGLYPKFAPELYLDTTYQTPTMVIQGHDGSITPAFGDFRDQFLLELELRIYNNIKANYANNAINLDDVIPGRFRKTDYSLLEYNQILGQNFLSWAGTNNVDYSSNTSYDANNPWTWNYAQFPDSVSGDYLQGSWRAIYNYWFDTDTPNLTPWRMLGFSSMPSWWTTRYGPAPYTSGNTLLWSDLSQGYIWNNNEPYTDSRYVRPNLLSFIPVDSSGDLLSPIEIPLISQLNASYASANFASGQQGPAESAWRRSSDYPYAVQATLAITKPAQYFATQFDTSSFYKNPITGYFSQLDNQKIKPSILKINGFDTGTTVQRTSGYVNWIADNIKNLGMDPLSFLNNYFTNLSVQLNYKISGYTDKDLLTVSAEQTSPGSTSSSVIIPNNNYSVYLNKSTPIGVAEYSAIVIENTGTGYSVSGYNPSRPYFVIYPSLINNNTTAVTVNGESVKTYNENTGVRTIIPYGTVFRSVQQTVDFIVGYGRYLSDLGFVFEDFNTDLGLPQNWDLSVQEFMYWSQQGWGEGNVIVLNPAATGLKLQSIASVVDEITNTDNGNKLLNQDFIPIKPNNYNVQRKDSGAETAGKLTPNVFTVTTLDNSIICYAKLNLVQYEHVLVFDNVDDFGDIIYIPSQGSRQYRLKLFGSKTGFWNGSLSAPGYIYSDPTIALWSPGTDYKLGDIVKYNNFYYTATADVPASQSFNLAVWTQILQNSIQTGMLPNFAHNAQKFINFYDVDLPPLEDTFQNYSAGLIGFRERNYLTDLGLTIPTQTKFYQGFIKQKGTINSVNALTTATFNNVQGNITVYEEWAFQVGKYGGLNSNTFKEFVLDQNIFTTNPVAFTSNSTFSNANIIVNLNGNAAAGALGNVYNASNLASTVTSIYNNRAVTVYPTDMPDAGYMNLNDVDYAIYDIAQWTQPVNTVGIGNKVWIAHNYVGQWDILRVCETDLTATQVTYTLDNYATIKFNAAHSFEADDVFILKDFGHNMDNVYQIVRVINSLNVTIAITNKDALVPLIRVRSYTGSGIVYALRSARYQTTANLASIAPPKNGWLNNDHVWVNNATANGWGTYTFNNPWLSNTAVKTYSYYGNVANNNYGSAVKVNSTTGMVYVGNPGNNTVQIYGINNGAYQLDSILSGEFTPDVKFGASIDTQGNTVVIGAPGSNYVQMYQVDFVNNVGQLITGQGFYSNANVGFGKSVAISADETWVFASGLDTVVSFNATQPETVYESYSVINSVSGATASWGNVIKTNNNGSLLFVADPKATNGNVGAGNVYIYQNNTNTGSITLLQTITSLHNNQNANFGTSIAIDSTGGNLFVGAPGSTASGYLNGVVERWVRNTGGQYVRSAVIAHPNNEIGQFGVSVSVSSDGTVLGIGSQGSAAEEHTTFDNTALTIDASTTNFIDYIQNSGAVYMFEPFINTLVANDVGTYLYTRELETPLEAGDMYGSSLDVSRAVAVAGAPGYKNNAGEVVIFVNPARATYWNLTRQQTAQVDINSISRTFLYNLTNNNILAALDYIDPKKGKVLSSVETDIDYKLEVDPAKYNNGTGTIYADLYWGPQQVGQIWWDLSTVRFIDYEQDDLIYRLNHWGQMFPGSSIDIYQWVESTVPPSQYVAHGYSGTPLATDDSAYSSYGYATANGMVKLHYYFWVKGIDTIATKQGKFNSVLSIAEAIENPQSQGIPYATILRNDTVALYNVDGLLTGQKTVLQLGSQTTTPNLVHSEYQLVQQGNSSSQIPKSILTKLIDSLAGIDTYGNVVPNPALIPSQRYGIGNRPIQTMIMNRVLALQNYFSIVNPLLAAYPVVERKSLTLLNSSESIPTPGSKQYNLTVNSVDELAYIDTTNLSPGYQVLVTNDANSQGRWTIYTLQTVAGELTFGTVPTMAQSYKTNLYWNYIDWYDANYNSSRTPDLTVANLLELGKLTLTANTYVKVLNAGNDNFVIYYIDNNLNRNLVGIENGTIQINTTNLFESYAQVELRHILLAMQDNIFIDDLVNEYNNIFFAMINYILTEQKNLDWVFKTSFISATQRIRKLQELPSYIPDNQTFYLDYINEVKPYRTLVREFVVDYIGNDYYNGDITDFDLPPYWDATLGIYRSPTGTQSYDSTIYQTGVYRQWLNNYKYQVADIVVKSPGTGYLFAPQIVVKGGGGQGVTAVATVNAAGGIASITVLTPGSGFTSEPEVIINGVGTGAVAYAVLRNVFVGNNMGHNLVRSISTTMRFDRLDYTNSNTFVFWDNVTANTTINANSIIVNNGLLYQLSNTYNVGSNIVFPTANITSISASNFNTANDRITAFNGNVNLALYQSGIDYPGVIVDGNTYIGTQYDTNIKSFYSNVFGVNPGDIQIDGGAYYDTYNSHAPEELVPGRVYDALNLEVFTNDGSNLAFRIFDDMNGNSSYYRIGTAKTQLAKDLLITDKFINVVNAEVLPTPNPALGIPGVVFINGEKITYYRNYITEPGTAWTPNLVVATDRVISYGGNTYLTTGNVYASTFASIAANTTQISINSLGQIRRAVDGTAPTTLTINNWHTFANYPVGAYIYYQGNTYVTTGNTWAYNIPWTPLNATISVGEYVYFNNNTYVVTGNVYSSTFANISSNLTYVTSGTDSGFASISANIQFAFVGNVATRHVANSYVVDSSILQSIPGTATKNLQLTYANTYTMTDYVSYGLRINGTISANIGDVLTQIRTISNVWTPNNTTIMSGSTFYYNGASYQATGNVYGANFANVTANVIYLFAGNTANTVTMRALQTVTNSNVVPVIITAGTLQGLPEVFDSNLGFDADGGDEPFVITASSAPTTRPNVTIPSWSSNTVFTVGSVLQYNGNVYTVLGNVYSAYFANISSQSNISSNITTSANSTVYFNGNLSNYTTTANVLQPYDQWYNTTTNQLYYWTGSSWTANLTTTGVGFDNTTSPIYINNNVTSAYVNTAYILGKVNIDGQTTVAAGTSLVQGNIWYSRGNGTPSNGHTLDSQTGVQATFLKASRGGFAP